MIVVIALNCGCQATLLLVAHWWESPLLAQTSASLGRSASLTTQLVIDITLVSGNWMPVISVVASGIVVSPCPQANICPQKSSDSNFLSRDSDDIVVTFNLKNRKDWRFEGHHKAPSQRVAEPALQNNSVKSATVKST